MGYYDEAILAHHGILGQKWGVRRFESANGTLTAAGKKRYTTDENGNYQKVKKTVTTNKVENTGNKTENQDEESKKGLSDKQKKMIVAGAAVVGTALAAYGGYKYYQHVQNTKKEAHDLLVKRGNEATMKALQSEHAKEMSAIREYTEAISSRDGHHTSDGGLLVDPEYYKNHWVGVAQKHKAEINEAHADYMKKAENISSSYKQSKKYLKSTKNNKEGDVANREWYLNNYDLSHFTKKEKPSVSNTTEKVKKSVSQNITRTTPPPIPESEKRKAATNKLASEASALARSVTAEGPKSFSSRPAQKSSTARQSNLISTVNTGKKAVSNTTKIHGQTKFSQASKANDDLVSDLLKKNAAALAGF